MNTLHNDAKYEIVITGDDNPPLEKNIANCNQNTTEQVKPTISLEEQFRAFAKAYGLELPEKLNVSGKKIRIPAEGKNEDNKSALYRWNGVIGYVRDFTKGGDGAEFQPTDITSNDSLFTEEEEDKVETEKKLSIYYQANTAHLDHPYLVRKSIGVHPGVKQLGDILLIPFFDSFYRLRTLQSITSSGTKRFLTGVKKGVSWFQLGELKQDTRLVYICEGFSAACSVYEAVGVTTIVAGGAANIPYIVTQLHRQCWSLKVVIAGDADETSREAGKKADNCIFIEPIFAAKHPQSKDFNDLANLEGLRVVRRQLTNNKILPPITVCTGEKSYNHSDIAQSGLELIARNYGPAVIVSGQVLIFDGKRWAAQDDKFIAREVNKLPKTVSKDSEISGPTKLINLVLSDPERLSSFFKEEPLAGINLDNGLLKISDNGESELLRHHPRFYHRHVLPLSYKPVSQEEIEKSLFYKFLKTEFGNDEDGAEKAMVIAEGVGAGLTSQATRYRKAFMFWGETARNGKTQLLNIITALFPKDSISNIGLGDFCNTYKLATLRGAMVNIKGETPRTGADMSDFKHAICGEKVLAGKKYVQDEPFDPKALHLFACNRPQIFEAGGLEQAVLDRFIFIEFNRRVEESDPEFIRDISDLIIKTELSIVLDWAIKGAIRLIKNGKYTLPSSAPRVAEKWAAETDRVREWFACNTTQCTGFRISIRDAYAHFKAWVLAEEDKETPIELRSFSQRLKALSGVGITRDNETRYFTGFSLGRVTEQHSVTPTPSKTSWSELMEATTFTLTNISPTIAPFAIVKDSGAHVCYDAVNNSLTQNSEDILLAAHSIGETVEKPATPHHILDIWKELEPRLNHSVYDRMKRAIPAIKALQENGIGFDTIGYHKYKEEQEKKLLELEPSEPLADFVTNNLLPDSTYPRNLDESPKIGMFDIKTNLNCFDHDVQEILELRYLPCAKIKAELRSGEMLLKSINNDRIYSHYSLAGSVTGRIISQGPNLQGIPLSLKRFFKAKVGSRLIFADYSQQELRIVSVLAKETKMLEAFNAGEDIHTRTASLISGTTIDQITKEQRSSAKALNFGLLYGMGPEALAVYALKNYGVHLTAVEAKELRERWLQAYPAVALWQQAQGKLKTITTLGGRSINLSGSDKMYTQSLNGPVQGTAADILVELLGSLPEKMRSQLVNIVHDEVILECKVGDVLQVEQELKKQMEDAACKIVPGLPIHGLVSINVNEIWT